MTAFDEMEVLILMSRNFVDLTKLYYSKQVKQKESVYKRILLFVIFDILYFDRL